MSPSSNEPASSFTSGASADASKGLRPDSSAAGTQSEQPEQGAPFDSQSLNNSIAVGKDTGGKREVVGEKGKKKKSDDVYDADQAEFKTSAATVVTEGYPPSVTDKCAVAKGRTGQETFPGPSGKTPTGLPLGKSSTHNACTSSYVVY